MLRLTLLPFLIIFLVSCEAKPVKDEYGLSPDDKGPILAGLLTNSLLRRNTDGTTTDPVTGLIWQTCAVGQTFRAASNDCQGSLRGSTLNPLDSVRFGAKELAFCDTKTHACNQFTPIPQVLVASSQIGIAGTSEAFQACSSLGSTWRVASPFELKRLTEVGRNSVLANFPQTPEGDFWSSWSNEQDLLGETALAVSFDRQSFGQDKRVIKTERNFVRCVRNP